MPREQRRRQRARPARAGEPEEREERERGIAAVQQHARGVVAARIPAEQRHVGRMGEPSERVPVRGLRGPQGPAHRFPGKSRLHPGIRRHVVRVVVVDEAVTDGPGEHEDRDQEQRGRERPLARVRPCLGAGNPFPTEAHGERRPNSRNSSRPRYHDTPRYRITASAAPVVSATQSPTLASRPATKVWCHSSLAP